MTLMDAELVQIQSYPAGGDRETPRADSGVPTKGCVVPLREGVKAKPNTPALLRRDLRTLATFVRVYCEAKHDGQTHVVFKGFDMKAIAGQHLCLCPQCTKLLHHAFVKRTACPRDPKPQCKDCPTHCYAKVYREQIREVMRFSGMRLLLRGRIDYLFHLFF